MIEFLHSNLWKRINSLAQTKERKKIAVAYLGKGANELLPLSKGDVLVVNMCFQSIESGIVNPFEIEKYSIKGVNIYNCENLHAKIYLFHDKAIICSANISENSQSNLIEAGVFVDEKSTINDISKYIDSICIEEITQGYIDLCKEKYNEPKNKGKIRGKQLIEKPAIILSRLWLINVRPALFKEEEDIILSRNKTLYKRKLQSPQNSIADIRFGASSSFIKNVREGDLVIRIFNQNKKTTVSEPMRVLGIDNGRKVNLKGHRNMFLRLEEPETLREKSWTNFNAFLKANAITSISKKSTKQIINNEIKIKLINFLIADSY